MQRVQAQALCSFFPVMDMDLNWLASEEEFEDSLHIAGLSLHDKWIWSSLQRQPSTSEEPRKWNCILCKMLWPEVLLWPGRMKLRISQEEVHALTGALSAQGYILDSRYVRGVYFSVGTLILSISDDLEPLAEFLPPSLCPACCVTVQNKPRADSEISNSILVKSSSVDLRNVPMRIALDNAQNVFSHEGDGMILSEEMLELGFGRRALRLLLPSAKSMYSSLRQGVPGCSIDYLPAAAARLTIVVYPASLHIQKQRDTPALNSFEVANWLSSAANCDIVSCENTNTHLVVAELANIDSWYRALALNGEVWQNTVMNVRGTELEIANANANLRQHRRFSPATRRIMLHWFRALRCLGVVAKSLVVAFLGEPPIIVPNDIASIEEALKTSKDIIIAAGTYELPRGLTISSAADLTGDGEVLLRLGSEVLVQSKSGANFRNLHFVASNVRAVISIRSSYLVALGRGYRAYSDLTPIGSKSAFACCSFGQFAVNLTKCRIQGGHHSVDVRGGDGVRARTGKRLRGSSRHPALHHHEADGLDFGRWLEHCRNYGEDQEPQIEFSRKSNAYVPVWKPHKMTFVRMIDCEISNSRTEAVNVWRGARLEMIRCWIHSCGQGVSVSHFLTPKDLGVFKEFQVTPHVSIRECLFENIAKKDWSSAISIGRFVTMGHGESSLTKTLPNRGNAGLNEQVGLVVELFHNTLRFCSGGVTAYESNLLAHGNKAEDIKYAAFHIFNGVASLEENEINRCASALTARSGQSPMTGSAKLNLRSNLLQNSEIGLRLATSASGAPLQLELAQDSLTNLGNGAILQGSLCKVAMKDCLISHCKRIGLHALREASVKLLQCRISDNGRGVVVASGSAALIHGCSFERNVGWAIRFEAEGPEENLGASRALNPLRSDVTFNEFSAPSKGNAGRKRVRVDTRNANVQCIGNREPGDGHMVEPQVKCQKT
eukprot:s1473_g8.t1